MTVLLIVAILTMLVLTSASIHDVRSRLIPDIHWKLVCLMAAIAVFFEYEIECAVFLAAGYAILSAYMFSDRLVGAAGVVAVAAGCAVLVMSYLLYSEPSGLVTAVMFLFMLALYCTGLLRGGGDAKAMMSLSMLLPVYPEGCCILWEPVYPAAYAFNPVFSIMLLALLFSLLYGVKIICLSRKQGAKGITAYRMTVKEARSSFVWPLEDIVDGEKVRIKAGGVPKDALDRLEAAGVDQIWVTPMIPFVLPITIAYAIVLILGSPLFLLV